MNNKTERVRKIENIKQEGGTKINFIITISLNEEF
jgi:hypothetical protein